MFQHMQKKLVAGGIASWVVIKPRVLGHGGFGNEAVVIETREDKTTHRG